MEKITIAGSNHWFDSDTIFELFNIKEDKNISAIIVTENKNLVSRIRDEHYLISLEEASEIIHTEFHSNHIDYDELRKEVENLEKAYKI